LWILGAAVLVSASDILTETLNPNKMASTFAKHFSSFYALFSGVIFLSTIAIFFAPIAHRILHTFHIEDDPAA
jgi:ATP/ADP translocase